MKTWPPFRLRSWLWFMEPKLTGCRVLTITTLCLALTACGAISPALTPPVNHNGPLNAGTLVDCQAMCANVRRLHCPSGDPTPKGEPCENVCENVESSGYASENPRCQAKATSCDAADACADEASAP